MHQWCKPKDFEICFHKFDIYVFVYFYEQHLSEIWHLSEICFKQRTSRFVLYNYSVFWFVGYRLFVECFHCQRHYVGYLLTVYWVFLTVYFLFTFSFKPSFYSVYTLRVCNFYSKFWGPWQFLFCLERLLEMGFKKWEPS